MGDLLVFTRIFIEKIIEPGKKYQIRRGMTIEFSASRQLCGGEPIPGERYDLYFGNNAATFVPAFRRKK